MSINLLAWREARRQANKKQFSMMLGVTGILALLIVGVVHLFLTQEINQQQMRNTYLRGEAGALDRKIREIRNLKEKRKELLARMQVIQGLQGNRPVIVQVFDALVRVVPKGIYFSQLAMKDQTLSIKGIAENNNSISSLMRRLDNSVWFDNPGLTAVKALDSGEGSQFNLNIEQIMPVAAKEG